MHLRSIRFTRLPDLTRAYQRIRVLVVMTKVCERFRGSSREWVIWHKRKNLRESGYPKTPICEPS